MKQLAIFASGNGSNAENIIKYFKSNNRIRVVLVVSNKHDAKVLLKAKSHNITTHVFNRMELGRGNILKKLKENKVDFIVLSGFLLKITDNIIKAYAAKIINIHPSLLPLYGGKGMYGIHVHQKVFESKDTETGITIHFVNHSYDEGAIIFQAKCPLLPNTRPRDIQKKVHKLEMKFFPRVIESLLNENN